MSDDCYGYYDFSDEDEYNADSDDLQTTADSPADVLKKYWGYDSFRPVQSDIIYSVLAGNDTIGLLPTGGGKSITFQVPALMKDGTALVITPLISLMKDQVDNLAANGIKAAYMHAGMSRVEADYTYERCRQGKVKLLYVAPERIGSDNFKARLNSWKTSIIVVDEAHCISQWGYDFRPSYLKISQLREILPGVPILALTASATPEVVDDIARQLGMTDEKRFSIGFRRDNISFLVRNTDDKFSKLLDILGSTDGSTIIYTRSRKKAADIADQLCRNGFKALYYHAGLDIHDKTERQDSWRSGATRIMVATTAFGMGIDKADVRLVVHYDLPSTLEEYYQEAGRAGRDGKPAIAVMLTSASDKATLARRLSMAFPDKDFIRHTYDEICRFLSLPMGEGFGAVFDFKPAVMCARYDMPEQAVMNAIAILARAEYFDYVDELDIKARVMILLHREELYRQNFDDTEELVMNYILRNYGGLFTDFVFINEPMIARECGITPQNVYEILCQWQREHLISYIPRKRTPQIFFTANRVPSSELIFPKEIYEDRRKAMEKQINATLDFAFGDDRCRVVRMLEYFGEESPEACLKCDVCHSQRSGSTPSFDSDDFEQRLNSFFDVIAPCEWLDTRSLRPYFPRTFTQVTAYLRLMVERGQLQKNGHLVAKVKNH